VTPGLPGAGIGGLFYLLAALFSPVWEAIRLLRGNGAPRQWVMVLRLFALALSIVAAMWLTAWIVVAAVSLASHASGGGTTSSAAAMSQTIGRRMAVLTASTLALVLLGVELLRLLSPTTGRTVRRCSNTNTAPVDPTNNVPLRAMGNE
jgi:hypothetical protein